MSDLEEIDVARIVDRIRERARERGAANDAPVPASALQELTQQVEADLGTLHTDFNVYGTALGSHRRSVGRLVVGVKNLLRRLLSPILLRQVAYNAANTRFVSALRQQIDLLDRRTQTLEAATTDGRQELARELARRDEERTLSFQEVAQQLRDLEIRVHSAQQALDRRDQERGAWLDGLDRRLRSLETERLRSLETWVEGLDQRLRGLETLTPSERAEVEALVTRIVRTREEEWRALRAQVARTEGKVRRLLYAQTVPEGERSAPSPLLRPAAVPAPIEFDSLGFGETFWGSREEVMERRRPYVELFRDVGAVIDLGCGRGEFVELLRAAGVEACGVDDDRDMLLLCRDLGLPVEQADALSYLRSRTEGSLGGIFAAHVLEHVDPALVIEFVHLAFRALGPGGRLVLETPNPSCLMTFASAFYMDFTHTRPLHPEALRFLARSTGFRDVEIRLLAPVDASVRLPILNAPVLGEDTDQFNRSATCVNELLFGPQDYALLARKP